MRRLRRVVVGLFVACPAASHAQSDAPYVTRGRQVEALQKALATRTSAFHDTLAAAIKVAAPDLLPKLEPPAPIATGYQLLPSIVRGPSPIPNPPPSVLVSYGWGWSTTLLGNETKALDRMSAALAAPGAVSRRSALDSLTGDFRALVERKKGVDADVQYNWLWQGEITRLRPIFDRNTAIQNAILRMRSAQSAAARAADSVTVADGLAADVGRIDPPPFLKVSRAGSVVTITVPMVTDITDAAFVAEFERAVADRWKAKSDSVEYRVQLQVRVIKPVNLYCGDDSIREESCEPPHKGAAINMPAHLALFPKDVGILTTGAGSTHFESGRVIVMSSYDAPWHLLAHEFGHMLGFHDAYVRGYRDAGADGFVVTELVVDTRDIMGNSKDGGVHASHFERLIRILEVPSLMKAGLDAFYQRNDAKAAAAQYREVLARQPGHYGAEYQLAKTLDALGQRTESSELWRKVLSSAIGVGDTATARQARERLGASP